MRVSNQPDGMFNDQNDFNRNVLENGMNGATSMPQQISVADETGQVTYSRIDYILSRTERNSPGNFRLLAR